MRRMRLFILDERAEENASEMTLTEQNAKETSATTATAAFMDTFQARYLELFNCAMGSYTVAAFNGMSQANTFEALAAVYSVTLEGWKGAVKPLKKRVA